ncbi:hypothetical protein TWF696_008364 [Orbilia brochopaga]|uniref:Ribosomal protein L7Ae/L30e/S12e/Gadd45 domain-containing protein n=1 Tax=Orbilia brochopaga TaxID=3140254 RepID=A0AAV9UGQ2_9PEZI
MASIKDRARKAKTIFTLDTPSPTFLTPAWPLLPPSAATALLTTLTSLLTSLAALPPFHDKPHHILTGINAVTTHLEHLASHSSPPSIASTASSTTDKPARKPLAIFATRSDHPPAIFGHLPLLCSITATPLLPLPKSSDAKLARILRRPRIYAIAIFADTPGADSLSPFLRHETDNGIETLGIVAAPDAFKSAQAGWQDTRSKPVQTTVGPKQQKKREAEQAAHDDKDTKDGGDSKKKRRGQ